jgi:two-component system sensor histidine kinase/response regulator
MDYKMPGMDGIEAGRRITRARGPSKVPAVVLVTAHGREEVMRRAESVGFDGFLIKPVSPSVLLNTILEVFGRAGRRSPAPATPTTAPVSIRGARLLVAEDNEINQQVAREILESAGLVVDVAANGREAVDMARANAYDAVLMDIQMPELDGLQATQELRRDGRFAHLPILAMTAHAMAGDREKSLQAGMNDHVTKPIDPDELFAALHRWVKPADRPAAGTSPPTRPEGESPQKAPPPDADGLPGIDRVSGLRRVAGNETLYRKLLLDFHRDYATSVERLRAALAEGRAADAERQAHTLKGVAGNIGATELHRAAQELDSALRLGDVPRAGALLAEVGRELSVVIGGLGSLSQQAAAARPKTPAGAAVDRPALERSLRELADLVHKKNPDAEGALESLRAALKGARSKDVEGIAAALDVFDFRGAAKAVAALAGLEGVALGA